MDPGAGRPGSLNERSGSIELPPNSIVYICPRRLLQQRTPSPSSSAVVLISVVSVCVLCPLFSLSPASCTLCIVIESSWHRSPYPALLECDRDSGPAIRVTGVDESSSRPRLFDQQISRHDSLAAPAASMFLPSGFVLHGGMWIADYSSRTSIRTLASATFSVPLPRADITSSL